MRYILTVLVIVSSFATYSQTKVSTAYNKVKTLYLTSSYGCKVTPKQCSIYFNKTEQGIDIIDVLIPLMKVEVRYRYSELVDNVSHFVMFSCINGNCLYNSRQNKNSNGLSIPFSTKEDCYEFIDAIAELKKALENN